MGVAEEVKAAPDEVREPKRPRLRPFHWAELHALPSRPYLVKHLLDADAISLLVGEPGSMKTFVALDLSLHIALGWEWCGRRVHGGAIIYIACEGGRSLSERLAAFAFRHDVKPVDVPFYVVPTTANLKDAEPDLGELISEIDQVSVRDPVKLLIVDTLSRALVGGNENGPEDMGAFVENVGRLREATGAHVLIIHHVGKDATRGARGHSLLRAAVDTEMVVEKTEDICLVRVTKQRDHAVGDEFGFEWVVVEIGKDEDEETVTSLVLRSTDRRPEGPESKLPPQTQKALDLLRAEAERAAIRPPDHVPAPPNAKVIRLDRWRELCDAAPLAASPTGNRMAFSRAKKRLEEDGAVQVAGDTWVWEWPDRLF